MIKMVEDFVKGCDILVHAGTPFILDVKDAQKELFEPTVQGTRNFLEAISKSKDLKKSGINCFCSCIKHLLLFKPSTYPADHIFTEADTPYISEQIILMRRQNFWPTRK
jgi:dihydroflavonol-4-reductase